MVTHYPEVFPFWQRIILGIFASLLFFVAVSMREFALNFLAISRGIQVKPIVLFIFGGMPRAIEESTGPVLELLMGLAGLLSNLVVAGVFYIVHSILINAGNIVADGFIQWLAYIFFLLALFHFIPGFPLDGGRLLRAILWKASGNYYRATHITAWIGQGFGLICITGGILLSLILQQWFNGITLILVGWALHSAALYCRRHAVLHESLGGVRTGDILTPECPTIVGDLSLSQLVRDCVSATGQRYFVVTNKDGELQGALTMGRIKAVPRKRWEATRVSEVMVPASQLKAIDSQQPAVCALEEMDESGTDQMPISDRGRVIGFVTRNKLLRVTRTRAELKQ
jgi:Zn-dependent protease